MCGIAGIIDSEISNEVLSNKARAMIDALSHRGPDSQGIWARESGGLVLAHRRLSIQDLSSNGNQPMVSESRRYCIVYNGEIYNFKEIASALVKTGRRFSGGSDTEVLLAAIEEWGLVQALERFVGMFAFALWDDHEQNLVLCRDRMGEKPLYYGWAGGSFYFSSELKAIERVAEKDGFSIDHTALSDLLKNGYISAPHSIYQNIHKLIPGTLLSLPLKNLQKNVCPLPVPYWKILDSANWGLANQIEDEQQAIGRLDDLLHKTIKRQMIADVDVGMFLSGGIDSSIVCSVAQAESSKKIRTYTIGFGEKEYDESVYAKNIAQHLGTEHLSINITPQDALQVVPKMSATYDEPFADSSQILAYLVSSLARQHVTVCLSGDGGDELFAGYNRYIWTDNIWSKLQSVPVPVRKIIGQMLALPSPKVWDGIYKNISSLKNGPQKSQKLVGLKLQKLAGLMQQDDIEKGYEYLMSYWQNPQELLTNNAILDHADTPMVYPDSAEFINRAMYLDQVQYLPGDNLAKVDRASMAVSLETRLPLLSHEIVDFSWQLPLSMKVRNNDSKWILKQVLNKYVPEKLTDRPKMGFSVPVDRWLRGELREWAGDLLSSTESLGRGLFREKEINRTWDEHCKGKRDHSHRLWTVLMFLAWSADRS